MPPHIVSIVFNGVKGDSRVIKTAKAATNAGYRATVVGVSTGRAIEETVVEGVNVILVPHHAAQLRNRGLWGGDKRDIRLLAGSYQQEALPQIVALEPDIIHSHDMICVKIGAASVKAVNAAGRSARWIHDIHEFVSGLRGELQEQYIPAALEWERDFFAEADHLVTVSDALADEVEARYPVSRPTVTFNCPSVRTHRDSGPDIRSTIGLAEGIPLVVFVGGASALRGCETILQAVSQVPHVHLVMVSKGPYVDALAARAQLMGMRSRFHLLPYVASDEVTSFIRTADVGIHGLVHYPNAEVAMPNKMFEYLHAGLPIVTSDVKSMKNFVDEHGVGCTFIAEDAASCADAIRKALERGKEFRANITSELREKYSWEAQEFKLQGIYEGLLARPHVALKEAERSAAATWVQNEHLAHKKRLELAERDAQSGSIIPPAARSYSYRARKLLEIVRRDGVRAGLAVTWGAGRRLFKR